MSFNYVRETFEQAQHRPRLTYIPSNTQRGTEGYYSSSSSSTSSSSSSSSSGSSTSSGTIIT